MTQHCFRVSFIQDPLMVYNGCMPQYKFLNLEVKTFLIKFSFYSFQVSFLFKPFHCPATGLFYLLGKILFLSPTWSYSSCTPEFLLAHPYLTNPTFFKLYVMSFSSYLNFRNLSWYDLNKCCLYI